MKFLTLICIAVTFVTQIRSGRMTGGWSDVTDVNSPQFQEMISFANEKLSARSNSMYLMKPIEVLDAKKQVVAGLNYRFTLRTQATSCKKRNSENIDLKECELIKCGAVEKCDVVVWEKAWEEPKYKMTKHECHREPKSC